MSKELQLTMTGDWFKAGIKLKNIAVRLHPAYEAVLMQDGNFVLEKMRGHIDSQDLSWTPLSKHTVELKGGSTTIYVETGQLRNGLVVRRIKSSVRGSTIYVGASPWKHHKSGVSMATLMMWMEYGTDKQPPRPLVEPTYEEVKDLIKDHWEDLFKKLVEGS